MTEDESGPVKLFDRLWSNIDLAMNERGEDEGRRDEGLRQRKARQDSESEQQQTSTDSEQQTRREEIGVDTRLLHRAMTKYYQKFCPGQPGGI